MKRNGQEAGQGAEGRGKRKPRGPRQIQILNGAGLPAGCFVKAGKYHPHPLEWVREMPVAAGEKVILFALASRAGKGEQHKPGGGGCWPSLPTLAADTGLSRRWVIKRLAALRKAGLVHRDKRGKQSYAYRLALEIRSEAAEAKRAEAKRRKNGTATPTANR